MLSSMAKQGRGRPWKDQASTNKHNKVSMIFVKNDKMVSNLVKKLHKVNLMKVKGKEKQRYSVPATSSPACPMADLSSTAFTPVMVMVEPGAIPSPVVTSGSSTRSKGVVESEDDLGAKSRKDVEEKRDTSSISID